MNKMEFTYDAYRKLLLTFKNNGYQDIFYQETDMTKKQVILRHDIDNSIEDALKIAKIEKEVGMKSTYFVLIGTEFYNLFTKRSKEMIEKYTRDLLLSDKRLSFYSANCNTFYKIFLEEGIQQHNRQTSNYCNRHTNRYRRQLDILCTSIQTAGRSQKLYILKDTVQVVLQAEQFRFGIARILYFFEEHWNELVRFSRRNSDQLSRWAGRYGRKG